MANSLGYFNPVFYAQETLKLLEQNLGMAAAVHRGFEAERGSFMKGQYINIPKPSTFTADNAPGSTVQDISTGSVQIALDQWKEVTFGVTDKEKAYTGPQIIDRHIQPAAYAIAYAINASLFGLYADVPWYHDIAGTPTVDDVIQPSKILFDRGVPRDPSNVFFAVGGSFAASLKGLAAFSQYQGSAAGGVATQISGEIGTRYGMRFLEMQGVPSHTKGTASTGTLAVNGATAAGATTLALDAGSVTGTLVAGDTFVIAGQTQRYAVTATATASGNAFASVSFTPPLVAAAADNAVVTVSLDDHTANLAFHRNAFALAMAPLDDTVPGGEAFTAIDPNSGLAIRASIQWNISTKKTLVSLDALWGVKTLDPNRAVRARG